MHSPLQFLLFHFLFISAIVWCDIVYGPSRTLFPWRFAGSSYIYVYLYIHICIYVYIYMYIYIWFSPLLLRFLRLGYVSLFFLIFSLIFLFHALEHVLFSHSPQSLLNILGERIIMEQCMELYLWNEWGTNEMMVSNFRCRSLAYSGCVRDLDHGSMTSFSPRVTTIQQDSMKKTSSICEG
jgi:hypothetical protein